MPILRNPVTISFHGGAASAIEFHLRAATERTRLLVDDDGGGHILEGSARAVEDGDLVGPRASRAPPAHDLRELGMNVVATEETGRERVLELPDDRALLENVGDDSGGGDERRVEL